MFRLETFGRLALLHGSGEAAAVPRLRLALLALLATTGDRGLSRDRVTALLWPESSTDNARHSLEQLVYALRRQLGDGFFLGTDPLRLNPEVLGADVIEFTAAMEVGTPERGVALFHGPFLDGFYLNGNGEFERWTEGERARLTRMYADALEQIATAAAKRRDHVAEVEWRQKLAAVDPLGTRNRWR